jgi:hypothetical protein
MAFYLGSTRIVRPGTVVTDTGVSPDRALALARAWRIARDGNEHPARCSSTKSI